jgi:ribosomal protein S18 acetylase RimI-like enzyme
MEYSIVRVNKENYLMHDNMIFHRKHGRDKTKEELNGNQDFNTEYDVLENENLFIYAAQIDSKFIAYISIAYIPKVGRSIQGNNGFLFIDELWTNPNYRKKGIAYALMKKADTLCRDMKIAGLRLYVSANNEAGISLYKKCGYEIKFDETLLMEKEA